MCKANHSGPSEESNGVGSVKPGTHCGVCGKLMEGDPRPGADVYHIKCLMKKTKHLREGPEADRRRAGRKA